MKSKLMVNAMGILAVSVVALLAVGCVSQAADSLPPPTGPHPTGRTSFHWQDAAREELETRAPDDMRELMVHLFYPTDASAAGERALYVPDAEAMHGVWDEEKVARAAAMRAYSVENAPLAAGKAKYPVAVFAPGGGVKALVYHALLDDLASHGWAVAAIDPPYNGRPVRFPDGRVLGDLPPDERGWPETQNRDEGLRIYQERIVHWCRDVSFVVDQLAALDAGTGPFAGRLDLERGVGVFGHSRGGQAAGTVRLLDERVRGGINIDGLTGGYSFQPVEGDGVGGGPPFLWFGKPLPPPPTDEQLQRAGMTRAAYDEEVQRLFARLDGMMAAVAGGALRVHLDRPGIAHMDFSDEPFWDGSMTPETRPGKLQTIADTRTWVRAFFDGAVRDQWADLKRLAHDEGPSQPDVSVYAFGTMWPSE